MPDDNTAHNLDSASSTTVAEHPAASSEGSTPENDTPQAPQTAHGPDDKPLTSSNEDFAQALENFTTESEESSGDDNVIKGTVPNPFRMPAGCRFEPRCPLAFDIGTGTGVLAAVLARRGIPRIVATDQDPRALACACENMGRLGLTARVAVVAANLFPPGRAPLIVCNPPWVPARANSPLERAVYDPDSRMLMGFIEGLAAHLEPGGEGWLVLSDLAEHLGLRSRAELLAAFDEAGLKVAGRMDAKPNHPRAADVTDPLHAARAAELISLWRLAQR